MFHILQIVNEKKNHIPPLKTNELTPFPYEVCLLPPGPDRPSSPSLLDHLPKCIRNVGRSRHGLEHLKGAFTASVVMRERDEVEERVCR